MLNQDEKRQLIALNIVRKEMNKYQKSLNMPVWVVDLPLYFQTSVIT
ncbi:hypothetical protein AB21_3940 [Escherichia coli 4-203-08_S1_C1]|nr:hypothetical protein AB11_2553 [Escherichia coli 1-176-05_S1_C1]EZK07453.1 hypothetical protein AB70_2600 [Escherichia coli 1-176-05_S1_C3]EZK19171.1 hypothetical protein AB39_2561 [Escherichia coli 1-176-05_S1_C2]KDU60522.1 hypothetical protein AB21_3940 [Escherichia coli 4-203-08_S1_C1]KEK92007.1 hypothetical protein AB49_3764 [Escherichia coli 4-203-08_S1_C2]KEK96945.1 hypothetical protein AB78_3654 [Escherichia coli 4-203-08_S1_C3]